MEIETTNPRAQDSCQDFELYEKGAQVGIRPDLANLLGTIKLRDLPVRSLDGGDWIRCTVGSNVGRVDGDAPDSVAGNDRVETKAA